MFIKKDILWKIVSYFTVAAIFYFLGAQLWRNWDNLRDYHFEFNYFYLAVSFFFLLTCLFWQSFIWYFIIRKLDPSVKLSLVRILQIFNYSSFGRYVPGRAWMYVGRAYLCAKEGISKKAASACVVYEGVLSILSAFLFSMLLLGVFARSSLIAGLSVYGLNSIVIIVLIVGGLVAIHPKIFGFAFRIVAKKIKRTEDDKNGYGFLSYFNLLKFVGCYFCAYALGGAGFFFLTRSVVSLSWRDMIDFMGMFNLAGVIGMVALLTPSGLGVREGILVVLMKPFMPISVAVVVSVLARLWATLGELIVFGGVYMWFKIFSKNRTICNKNS